MLLNHHRLWGSYILTYRSDLTPYCLPSPKKLLTLCPLWLRNQHFFFFINTDKQYVLLPNVLFISSDTKTSWPQLLKTTNSSPQNPISPSMSSDNNPRSHTQKARLYNKEPLGPPWVLNSQRSGSLASSPLFLFSPGYPILSLPCASCYAEGMVFWSVLHTNWTKIVLRGLLGHYSSRWPPW